MVNYIIRIIIDIFIFVSLLIGFVALYKDVNASEEWTQETQNKYERMKEMGFNSNLAFSLISECKLTAKDPLNCIKIGASIAGAESSMGNRCYRYNCVGMNDGSVWYSSIDEGVRTWVKKYNRYWYRQTTPKSFYRDDGIPPITHYCMGKKKDGVCKEGTKNSWKVFNSLNF